VALCAADEATTNDDLTQHTETTLAGTAALTEDTEATDTKFHTPRTLTAHTNAPKGMELLVALEDLERKDKYDILEDAIHYDKSFRLQMTPVNKKWHHSGAELITLRGHKMLTQAEADRWRKAAKDGAVVDWRAALPVHKVWAHVLPNGKLLAHTRIPRSEIERKVGIDEATTMLQSVDESSTYVNEAAANANTGLNPLEGDKEFIPISQQGKDQLSLDDAIQEDDLGETAKGRAVSQADSAYFSSVVKAVTGDDRRRRDDRRRAPPPPTGRRRGKIDVTATCYDNTDCDSRRRRGTNCGTVEAETDWKYWSPTGWLWLYYQWTDSKIGLGVNTGTYSSAPSTPWPESETHRRRRYNAYGTWHCSFSSGSSGTECQDGGVCSLCGVDIGYWADSILGSHSPC